MASLVLTDAYLTVGGTDLSAQVRSIELNYSAEVIDETAMGSTFRDRTVGLKDWSITVTFKNSFAASNVDATIFPLVGTSAAVVLKPVDTTTSSTNPQYSGNVIVGEYSWGGRVGDLSETSVTWDGDGTLTRATS